MTMMNQMGLLRILGRIANTEACIKRLLAAGSRALLWTLVLGLSVGVCRAETVTYYYTNPQGTPLATADAAGNILSTADYRPYGAQVLGTPEAGPGYTGHVNDPDSGLVYMQARYYDPVVGRFISVDPLGPSGGSLFGFSSYGYASGNPISRLDPTGMADDCGPGCRQLRKLSDAMGFSAISGPVGGGAGPLGQTTAGLNALNSDLENAGASEVRSASNFVDSVPGAAATACASGAACSAGELTFAAADIVLAEVDLPEIIAINKLFSNGILREGKSLSTMLFNMSYREGANAKIATVIRDIAGRGGHMFENGNKRTAYEVVKRMLGDNPRPANLRAVIGAAADGRLQTTEAIQKALEKGGK
ncbi:RHS repeat domain-containing protein [Luteibacter aegosomatissinici]|uniref:RHS repeat domain-containing protein n=1 Tax=Luteibacter aegosomatissinici TaxID=2911539 RepID=UPI001FFB25FF|nr:RHS repeat-associated core domain-containing protein [Luteibacter aegosomatissinici]UPG92646.1 hypothetical protein L2Y97_12285 [Luteibacter aegosomatissinici]